MNHFLIPTGAVVAFAFTAFAQHDASCDHDHGERVIEKAIVEPVHEESECQGDHDHSEHSIPVDPHAGHDHGDEAGGVELSAEAILNAGIRLCEAGGGTISKTAVFPAEINLNRDRTAAVSPRYASMVRQVFVEIGDEVREGDLLASLENRETLAIYSVSAPFDGVIISKDVALGEAVGDDQVLFEVADLSSVWAEVHVFPKYQHQIRKGQAVEFIAHDGHTAQGTLKYVSPIASSETRTFTARCVLAGASEDFTPGSFVRAQIKIATVDAMVVVPRRAVQTIEGEHVVFIPSEHGFKTAIVELGLADKEFVEIRQGLHVGESYVAEGAFSLKAEMVTSGMDPHAGHGH